jgi:hypothetical protein
MPEGEEKNRLRYEYAIMRKIHDPFKIVNFDPIRLTQLVDLHGGLSINKATKVLSKTLIDTKKLLESGQITPNVSKTDHIIEFVTGYGNH